jgi:hypothetical protein
MKLLMCRKCGKFVSAMKDSGDWVPTEDQCSKCDGAEFKDIESGRMIYTREALSS